MPDHNLTIYESLDLRKPAIPERSHLYHLKPMGVGTHDTESLTSYISRLAEAHSVVTGVLMLQEIVPQLSVEYEFKSTQAYINYQYGYMNQSRSKRALNGTGSMAASMVQALEALTLHSDLRSLTMLNWLNVLPSLGLLRPIRAWCPLCYQEWNLAGQVIYDPLIWAIDAVTVCRHHHCCLQTYCHHCHKQLLVWAWHSRPGYCSKCGEWLGISPNTQAIDSKVGGEDELKWQVWAVDNIGKLIAASPYLSSVPPRERVTKNILASVNQVAQGSVATFARLLGKYKRSLREWHAGRELPQLSRLLQICDFLEISLKAFLTEDVATINSDRLVIRVQGKQQAARRNPRKKFDSETARTMVQEALQENPPPSIKEVMRRLGEKRSHNLYRHFPDSYRALSSRYADYKKAKSQEEMQRTLEAVIKNNEYPPPSMEEVARRLKPDRRTLERNCPDLCRIISTRYSDYLKASRKEREEQLCQEVRQAALKVHAEGMNPHSRTVGKLLTKPGALRNKEAIAALREVRRSLGY